MHPEVVSDQPGRCPKCGMKLLATAAMDKTGTLTTGQPEVTDLVVDGLPEDDVRTLAAAVERESKHPLAAAVARHAATQIPGLIRVRFERRITDRTGVPFFDLLDWVVR